MESLISWLVFHGYNRQTVTKPPTLCVNECDSGAFVAWLKAIGGDHLTGVLLPKFHGTTNMSIVGHQFFQSLYTDRRPAAFIVADDKAHWAVDWPGALPVAAVNLPEATLVKQRLVSLLCPIGITQAMAEARLHGQTVPAVFMDYARLQPPRPPLILVGRLARGLLKFLPNVFDHIEFGSLTSRGGLLARAYSRDASTAAFTVQQLTHHNYVVVQHASFGELMMLDVRDSLHDLIRRTRGSTIVVCLDDEEGPSADARTSDNSFCWITPAMCKDQPPSVVAVVAASAGGSSRLTGQLAATAAWLRTPLKPWEAAESMQHISELHRRSLAGRDNLKVEVFEGAKPLAVARV